MQICTRSSSACRKVSGRCFAFKKKSWNGKEGEGEIEYIDYYMYVVYCNFESHDLQLKKIARFIIELAASFLTSAAV